MDINKKVASKQDVLSQNEMDVIDEKLRDLSVSNIDIKSTLLVLHELCFWIFILHYIWPNSSWKEPNVEELYGEMTAIKIIYRKALLLTHPDKQVGGASEERKYLAEQLFKNVQGKWEEYEKKTMNLDH
ncbi:hypothetical protein N665_1284s0003 [Sinapis alba]|nr:hypothetical protein N665_1284s0003 [Sinapis alba]